MCVCLYIESKLHFTQESISKIYTYYKNPTYDFNHRSGLVFLRIFDFIGYFGHITDRCLRQILSVYQGR